MLEKLEPPKSLEGSHFPPSQNIFSFLFLALHGAGEKSKDTHPSTAYERAVELSSRLGVGTVPEVWNNIGCLRRSLKRFPEAEGAFERGLSLVRTLTKESEDKLKRADRILQRKKKGEDSSAMCVGRYSF